MRRPSPESPRFGSRAASARPTRLLRNSPISQAATAPVPKAAAAKPPRVAGITLLPTSTPFTAARLVRVQTNAVRSGSRPVSYLIGRRRSGCPEGAAPQRLLRVRRGTFGSGIAFMNQVSNDVASFLMGAGTVIAIGAFTMGLARRPESR